MKTLRKIMSICVIGLLSAGALVGCTVHYSQDELNSAIENAKANAFNGGIEEGKLSGFTDGVNSVDVDGAVQTAVNAVKNDMSIKYNTEMSEKNTIVTENTAEIERLTAVIEDYKQAEEEIVAEENTRDGSEIIELSLGDGIGVKTYDDGDVDKLLDTSIKFDGNSYDVYEEIITTNDTKVAYSLIDDEDLKELSYIIVADEGALAYRYVFDDVIDTGDISRDEPLTISFLGKDMIVTDVSATDFEIKVGNSDWLDVSESIDFDGHTVLVQAVDEDGKGAAISVDGTMKWIDEGDDYEFDGITVAVEDVRVIRSSDDDASVKLTISDSEDVYQTYDIGDSVVFDEDEDDAEFVYTLDTTAVGAILNLDAIGVEHNQKIDELDDDFKPLKEGESIAFPNDYFSLQFEKTNIDKYMDLVVEFDDVEDESGTEFNGIVFTGSDDKAFEIDDEDTDTVYAWTINNGTNWVLSYIDDDDNVFNNTDVALTFKVTFEDTIYDVAYNGNVITIGNTLAGGFRGLSIDVETDGTDFVRLGATAEDAEPSDVEYTGIPIGTRDNDVLCMDGMIVSEPEDNADNDVVEIQVPEDEAEITLVLG